MGSRVEIAPACDRDLTFIASNLRPEDADEVFCQLPDGATWFHLAYVASQTASWVARVDGQPVCAFGFQPRSVTTLEAWAWGTRGMWRAIPAITRFVATDLLLGWLEDGVRRLEARSISTHVSAHRWMEATGAVREAVLPDAGKNGETFIQFVWTRAALPKVRKFVRSRHVHAYRA